jgi:uncharacterized protein (TIGR03437 family)
VSATIGTVNVPVDYAGPQGQFPGLGRVNILLQASLPGAGKVNVILEVDGQQSNAITLLFQ